MGDKSLFVATPMYGGMLYDCFARSMDALVAQATARGVIIHRWTARNESLITRARNMAVHDFLRSDATHLLFIDADITFPGDLALKMLDTGFPLVAASYPKKSINWEAVRQAALRGEKDLASYQADHVINVRTRTIEVENGCVEVLDAGTGFMLIERQVILDMQYAHPEWMYLSDSMQTRFQPMWSTFDCGIYDADIHGGPGRYLSEDYRFCREYQKMGGRVMLILDDRLEHTGTYTFKGKLPIRPTVTEYSLPEENDPRVAAIMNGRYEWAAKRIKGRKVANACAGPGYGLPILQSSGAEVTNFDRSEECLKVAEQRGWTPFVLGDVEGESFQGFTTLVSIETIEHLRDPIGWLRALHGSVRELVLSCPVVPTKHENPHHLWDFSYQEVLNVTKALGWDITAHELVAGDTIILHATRGS